MMNEQKMAELTLVANTPRSPGSLSATLRGTNNGQLIKPNKKPAKKKKSELPKAV